jgi:hypothetical protein
MFRAHLPSRPTSRPLAASTLVIRPEGWHFRQSVRRSRRILSRPLRFISAPRLFHGDACEFRPDLSLLAELNSIDGPDDFFPLGVVPREWLAVRTMGTAKIDGEFADIYAVEWVSYLRGALAAEALGLGIHDIDLSTLLMAEPRRITQLASREAYRMSAAGIFYRSRYGQSLENWALFEPVSLRNEESSIVAAADPNLGAALSLLAIELEGPAKSR